LKGEFDTAREDAHPPKQQELRDHHLFRESRPVHLEIHVAGFYVRILVIVLPRTSVLFPESLNTVSGASSDTAIGFP
jgi:hypothetical protein